VIRLAIVAFFTAGLIVAQVAPTHTIHGTVLDSVTGSPIPRATVALSCVIPRTLAAAKQALTDQSGGFQFIHLPAAINEPTVCNAQVARNGYLPFTGYIAADTLNVKLIPQSVITGIVLDEHGQPLAWAQVSSSHRVLNSGSYSIQPSNTAQTDDRGKFRIVGLAADAYRICVTPPRIPHLATSGIAYDRICYPDSPQEQLHLKTGETRDLRFDFKPVPAVRLTGHISNPASPPSFRLARETADGLLDVQDDHRWDPATSTFYFPAVIPGKYTLTAESISPTRLRTQRAFVVGSSNSNNLELTLQPFRELEGVIRADDGTPLRAELLFEKESGRTSECTYSDEHGAFHLLLSDLQPREVRTSSLPWHVQSIKQAGRDVVGTVLEPLPDGSWGKIEIVATRSAGSIEGTLRAAAGPSATDQLYNVHVLQERNSRVRQVTSGACNTQYGKFRIDNLPPGEYRILLSKVKAELPYLEPSYLASRAEFIAIVHVTAGQTSQVVVSPVPDDSDPMANR
jgi:hypothetical protein